jgi:hypothetical protein
MPVQWLEEFSFVFLKASHGQWELANLEVDIAVE